MEELAKKREGSIDIAKGIGILLVIFGHSAVANVSAIVSIFHMPFFFVLSGVFLSSKLPFHEFVKSRARRILIPYVFGVFLTIVFAVCKDIVTGETAAILPDIQKWILAGLYGKGAAKNFLVRGIVKIGAFWFLLATFYGTVIVRKFLDSKYLLAITAVIAYVGWATKQIVFLPFSLQNGMVASFFIAVGVYCRKEKIFERKADPLVVASCIGLTAFALVNQITLSMVNVNFPYGLLNVVIALATSYLVVKLSQGIEKLFPLIGRFLAYCGANSLAILCYHAVEINVFRWGWVDIWLAQYGLTHELVTGMSRFLLRALFCLAFTVVTNQVKPIKKVFS